MNHCTYNYITYSSIKFNNVMIVFVIYFRNPVFMTLSIFQFFNAFIISGFVTFGAKFVEMQFARTAATAGMLWGRNGS